MCFEGCSPGLFCRQCNMGCLPPGETCSKCPSHCDNGFCQLGDRCVSGCKDSYYGTGCFTCGPGCRVCNNVTGECYTCEQNCSFSDCFTNGDCSVNETSASMICLFLIFKVVNKMWNFCSKCILKPLLYNWIYNICMCRHFPPSRNYNRDQFVQ